MIKKKKISPLLILLGFFIFVLYGQLRSYRYENKLKAEGQMTIGRIDSIEELPKWSIIYISYNIKDKNYNYNQDDLHTGITKKDIGKFYEIKYLSSSPEIIRVNYSKQITDTTDILKAGFSMRDIENSNLKKI